MHWTKVEGSGLPHYVNGYLSNDRAHGGEYSFRFDLNGGSLIYRYDTDQITSSPARIIAWKVSCKPRRCQTPARRITAYLIDQDGRPIIVSVGIPSRSLLQAGDTSWRQIGVEINASSDDRPPTHRCQFRCRLAGDRAGTFAAHRNTADIARAADRSSRRIFAAARGSTTSGCRRSRR